MEEKEKKFCLRFTLVPKIGSAQLFPPKWVIIVSSYLELWSFKEYLGLHFLNILALVFFESNCMGVLRSYYYYLGGVRSCSFSVELLSRIAVNLLDYVFWGTENFSNFGVNRFLNSTLVCAAVEHPLSLLHDENYFGPRLENAIVALKRKGFLTADPSRDPSARIWSYIGHEVCYFMPTLVISHLPIYQIKYLIRIELFSCKWLILPPFCSSL